MRTAESESQSPGVGGFDPESESGYFYRLRPHPTADSYSGLDVHFVISSVINFDSFIEITK